MAGVVLENVNKSYREQKAVVDFSLEIKDQEFIVVVGPSGCGKTTTLRMIAGLEEISSGFIFIDGVQVNDLTPRDRNIAMVFQNYALYPSMTVYDNLAFGLKMHKADKSVIKEKILAVAKMLNIEAYLNRKPAKLSGGERQRVAIGRALVREPAVFLMDEPLSNLDARLRNSMRAELLKLHKQLKATIIYVTHDQTEAMTLGDRIVVMKQGLIQQVDTPQNIYNHPINKFVAEFIGMPPMNLLPAILMQSGGKYYGQLPNCPTRISLPPGLDLKADDKDVTNKAILVGIRPENIQLNHSETGVNNFIARMDVVERMGAEMNLHLLLGSEPVIIKTNANWKVVPDQVVEVHFPPVHLQVFEQDSGRNLGLSAGEDLNK
jgi:multiple sugar transport system ATP-binding protein